jgi:hypothetical protein
MTSPTTPSAHIVQRAKRHYGRSKPAARPDVLQEPTERARDPTMESSSVVEDSEPERVRYRECFASTDLSDPPTSANKNHNFGNWRHELERIDASESLNQSDWRAFRRSLPTPRIFHSRNSDIAQIVVYMLTSFVLF